MKTKQTHLLAIVAMVTILVLTAVPASAYSLGERTIFYGLRGSDVTTLQQKLNENGFNPGSVDGIFGVNTQQAVINYQKANGLKVDGIVGPQTVKALDSDSTTYLVKNGDSLWKISNKFGISITAIKQANGLNSNIIYPGQALKIVPPLSRTMVAHTNQEIDLLARVIHAEAKGESYSGKVAVGAVILNRVNSNAFPNTISGVIYQPYQFEPVLNGTVWETPASDAFRAANDALSGHDPTYGAVFFYNPTKVSHSWLAARQTTTRIGNHVFLR